MTKGIKLVMFLLCLLVVSTGCLQRNTPSVFIDGIVQLESAGDINSLILTDNTIWGGGRDGVFRFETSAPYTVEKLDVGYPLRYVKSLCLDQTGDLWIVHDGGLTRYSTSGTRLFTTENGLADHRINCVMQDADGNIRVGTWSGVTILDPTNDAVLETITTRDGLLHDMVNVMLETRDGDFWYGSYTIPDGGVSIQSATGWQHFNADNGLPNNNITSLLQDHNGDVWIGTGFYDKGGAVRFGKIDDIWQPIEHLAKSDGLAGEKVRSLFEHTSGQLWIGSEYDGLVQWQSPPVLITTQEGLTNNEVKTMIDAGDGSVWIGTRDGITILPPE